jgi:hypothetical protein
VRIAHICRRLAESDVVVGLQFDDRQKQHLEIGVTRWEISWRSAAPRAGGRLAAAAGCAERAIRRSLAVTTTPSKRLPQPWRCSSTVRAGGRTKAIAPRPVRARFDAGEARHAASRRRTAASMNRRPERVRLF